MNLSNRKGQHLSEYALIFSLVLVALIAMQAYVKRGLQGRYRDASDAIVLSLRAETGKNDLSLQYEPYYIQSSSTIIKGTADSPNKVVREEKLGGSIKTTIDNSSAEQYGEQITLPERYE